MTTILEFSNRMYALIVTIVGTKELQSNTPTHDKSSLRFSQKSLPSQCSRSPPSCESTIDPFAKLHTRMRDPCLATISPDRPSLGQLSHHFSSRYAASDCSRTLAMMKIRRFHDKTLSLSFMP